MCKNTMSNHFCDKLSLYVKQAGLPIRRIAHQANIPHQTIFNWLKGTQPRWHPTLIDDLRRLSITLGLTDKETNELLQCAGCISNRIVIPHTHENEQYSIPYGWFIAGSHPQHYVMEFDETITYANRPSMSIRACEEPKGFGNLMQEVQATAYHGKRLQFAATMRSANVQQWAGLWMRVDESEQRILAFDNMQNRPIKGTCDWAEYTVVLDVAETSSKIVFGFLLCGTGQIWIAQVRLVVTGNEVSSTDMLIPPTTPTNLNF